MGYKSKKKKQPKTQVVFNEEDRTKFLLGFRKRKQERKKKAIEELEEKIKQERKRQRELKAQAIMDERKKAGLPSSIGEMQLTKQNVIETSDNIITISDFSNRAFSSSERANDDDNDADEDGDEEFNEAEMKQSQMQDAEVCQSKVKINKECSQISERLDKLEKKRKALALSKTKMKKNQLKSKTMSKKTKSSRKYQIKDAKIKVKDKIKLKKRMDKRK